MRILIVEDQQRLADTLADIITENRDIADVSYDGISGFDNAMSGIYDAVILDIMLPGMDGVTFLRELRGQGMATPVLMLTARTELADRVMGLDAGADYYLTKPFEKDELQASLRAILRRGGEIRPEEPRYGGVSLRATGELACGERSIRISAREAEIMRLLIGAQGSIVPKETLLLKIWGYESEAEANNVEAYISFLRKKLAHIHAHVTIQTERRLGYRLETRDDS